MKNHSVVYVLVLACICLSFTHTQGQVKAAFSSNTISGCSPLVVQFHDESTGSPASWRWDLGNGTISLFQNPSTVYFAPGTYSVKLVVKSGSGADSIVKQQYITVYDNPVIDFTASDSVGCFPLPVTFTDKSAVSGGVIDQWKWDFGDGDTSIVQTPKHMYTASGNYTVTLKATSDKGCTKSFTRSQYIQITSGVIADFDYKAASNSCSAPVNINFTNRSIESGTVSYTWDFGDGQTATTKSPGHTYNANGSYTVTLVAVNNTGCRDTVRKNNLLVIGSTVSNFSIPDSVCAGHPMMATNTSTPTPVSVWWDFGDGSGSSAMAPMKTYSTAGTYPVKLTNNFATCTDVISKTVKVLPKPAASFTADKTYSCSVPAVVQFTNTSAATVASFWNFGDGATSTLTNPQHTYTSYGSYGVTLIVTGTNGCTDTIVKPAFINVQRPQVQINNMPVKGCLPLTVPFSATVNVNDVVTSYFWDFGDGTTSTLIHPSKTYTTEGNFTVKLRIITAGGCSDSAVVTNAVQTASKPVADFSATLRDVCSDQAVMFTNKSNPAGDQWFWSFGDGSTSTVMSPIHQFGDTGSMKVTLIVWNNGCSDTMVKPNYVYVRPPFSIFTSTMDCADKYTRNFIDKSKGAQTWSWDFGDGATSSSASPAHKYAARGIYKVQLTVTNGGCSNTNMMNVIVADEHPDFDASKSELCKGDTVSFTLKGYDPAYIAGVTWYFGDGTASNIPGNVSHVYTRSGLYNVSLVYRDANGCIDSTVKKQFVKVNGPSASFDVARQKICVDATATFRDLSVSDGTHAIVQWYWNYGDGTSQTMQGPPFTHTYTTGNSYTVSLKVTDDYGCSDNISKYAAIIVSQPKADFTSADTSSCPGKPVNFTNGSTGNGLQYLWSFGDGGISVQPAPVHQYPAPGLYTVNLLVTDPVGCRDSIKRTDYVSIVLPTAGFSMSDSIGSCPPLQVYFTNEAQHYTSIKWDFGDGGTSTLDNPVHFYNIPGTYFPTQTIVGPGGCTDVMTRKVVVKGPKGSFTYTPTTGCAPLTVHFSATGNGIASLIWDFNDGNTQASDTKTMDYTYNAAGSFVPRMVLIDSAGCQVPVTGADTINAIGVVAKATMDTYRVCNSGNVQFTDQSVANDYITGYRWDFGDGATSNSASPVHFYNASPVPYNVLHIVTTAAGCKDTLHLTDTIRVWAVPQVSITGDKTSCMPGVLNFQSVIKGDALNLQKHWDFGNGQTLDGADVAVQTYKAAGNYKVQLQTVYQNYCRDTAYHNVSIWPLPNTYAGKDTFVCRGVPVQLQASGADHYTWASAPDISCTGCAAPMINPVNNTSYVVTGVSVNGCVQNDTVNVRVRQPFTMQVLAGDTICAGERITLRASGAEKYQWFPATGLDNPNAANPGASPSSTIVYTVIGRDNDNCFADTGNTKVLVYPVPKIFAGNDTTVITGSTIQLATVSSADITKWTWTPAAGLSCSNCSAPKAAVKGNATYRVTASNEGGCTASDDIVITSVCNEGNWFLPNTFSPNGDGLNDVFYVRGKGLNLVHSLRIFNRWGQMVFEKQNFQANDAAAGWNGIFNGKPADMDVYVYIVEVVCDNSNIVPIKGNVALMR